jgi:hypothetical protein
VMYFNIRTVIPAGAHAQRADQVVLLFAASTWRVGAQAEQRSAAVQIPRAEWNEMGVSGSNAVSPEE